MTGFQPCSGPLCPLTALYGHQRGGELFAWLQQRLAEESAALPGEPPACGESDYFLVCAGPTRGGVPERLPSSEDVPPSGLQLALEDAAHPLGLDWEKISRLAQGSSLMVNFELHAYSAEEYRLVVEDLFAAAHSGVKWLRLDASRAPAWPTGEPFTARLEAHGYVQLVRRTLDVIAPSIRLVAGENLPQVQNDSFFGSGGEADMVENLALAPLLVDAIETGQATTLQSWVSGLRLPFQGLTFYNTLRLDGPQAFQSLEGILPAEKLECGARRFAGVRDFRTALAVLPGNLPAQRQRDFLTIAQAMLLTLTGVPGFDQSTLPAGRLLRARADTQAFSPYGAQMALTSDHPAVFSLMRIAPDGVQTALCFQNFTLEPQDFRLDLANLGLDGGAWFDRISGEPVDLLQQTRLHLKSGQALWLSQG